METPKIKIYCLILLAIAFISSDSKASEKQSQVIPNSVLKAAQERLNNFIMLGSELENKGDEKVYTLVGVADENIYKIEIDGKGHIINVQKRKEVEGLPLTYIPEKILESAKNAIDGINLSGASVEREHGELVYEVIGTIESKCYEIEVSSTGTVLEIEKCD